MLAAARFALRLIFAKRAQMLSRCIGRSPGVNGFGHEAENLFGLFALAQMGIGVLDGFPVRIPQSAGMLFGFNERVDQPSFFCT